MCRAPHASVCTSWERADETQDDVARMFERPQMEITAKPGSIEEKIQRVLYSQPLRKALAPDEELLELEFYLREGSGNRYNLVRGIAARYDCLQEGDKRVPIVFV